MGYFNLADYEMVCDRIKRFYQDHPDGRILTELVTSPETIGDHAAVKAFIYLGDILKATGYAYEIKGQGNVNRDAWVENCETSAIGRALANMDYSGSNRPSHEEMQKVDPSGLPLEDRALADVRDSRGNFSPPRDPGPIKPMRDGTRGALMEWQKKLNGLYATNYPDGSPVLSLDEKKDMVAEGRPGGRELQPTDSDLELARDVYEKYRAIIDHRLDIYHNGDSAKE